MKRKKPTTRQPRVIVEVQAKQPAPPPEATAPAAKRTKISDMIMGRSMQRRERSVRGRIQDHAAAFMPARPPPGVVPKKALQAMDEALPPAISWAGNSFANIAFQEGYAFLGYPYLAELAQVPEYRLISEVISTEATRKWITFQSQADEKAKKANPDAAEAKADAIKELTAEFERLQVKACFEDMSLKDGFFGRSHLYIDTGDGDRPKELATPIGEGGDFTWKKFRKKGFLQALRPVEAVWTYPLAYNAQDPLSADWYKPEIWYTMSKPVHATRLLPFIGKPVPDLFKPAFSFGGLSLTQMAKPYVDNWLETRQSVNDIIQAFSVMVLKTDLSTILEDQSGDTLFNRADLFNNLRNNRGLMMVNKQSEDFANVSAPLGTLDKLQAQAQEHICSVSRIPLVKYTGLSPTGLNASSEGELEAFDDTIHAYQEKFFRPHLTTVFKLVQLNLWGKIDEDLKFDFAPLSEMTEEQKAALQKTKSEIHKNYVDAGVVSQQEVRQALTEDPEAIYSNLDVDDVPIPEIEAGNIHERESDDLNGPQE